MHDPHKGKLAKRLRKNLDIYFLISIPIITMLIYAYLPMFGIIIAFKEYGIMSTIMDSPWVGFKHFQKLFSDPKFFTVFSNTLLINLYKFVWQFPIPILIALLLNEIRVKWFKRSIQTLTYLPHFLSWVVVAGIFTDILSPSTGVINKVIFMLTEQKIMFLGDDRFYRSIIVIMTAWKESGWSAIVYLSAITAIDPQLYEAASVEGAGRLKQAFNITLPGIASTIFFIIILRASAALSSDVEQTLLTYSPLVYNVGDVLGSYVYREGLLNYQYSYTTAVGLFTSVFSLFMMLGANKLSLRYTDRGLW